MRTWNRLAFAAGLAGALAFAPTTRAQTGSSDTSSSQSAQGAKVDKGLQEELQKIHGANQGEIQLAKIGEQQATSPDVKQFAQKMDQDHSKMDQKLQQQAQSIGAQLEGKAYQDTMKDANKAMTKLRDKTGQDFDKAFMSQMVKDHENVLKLVKKTAKDAQKKNQTTLASFLQQAETGSQGHLDQAKQIESSVKKGGKAQARTPPSGSSGSKPSGSADTSAAPKTDTTK